MLERYDDAVLKIHQAAVEPVCWGDALAAIADVTGSAGAVMRVLPLTAKHRSFAHVGKITLDQVAGYDARAGRCARARPTPAPIPARRSASTR